jgi:hypothetical protein
LIEPAVWGDGAFFENCACFDKHQRGRGAGSGGVLGGATGQIVYNKRFPKHTEWLQFGARGDARHSREYTVVPIPNGRDDDDREKIESEKEHNRTIARPPFCDARKQETRRARTQEKVYVLLIAAHTNKKNRKREGGEEGELKRKAENARLSTRNTGKRTR